MATSTTNSMSIARQFGNTPFGNATHLPFTLATSAAGVPLNTDQITALQIADVVRLGTIPAGFKLEDIQITISDAFTASTTIDIGFAYVDGVDLAGVNAQDAAYFCTGLATDATGVSRKTAVKAPLLLQKDVYLTATIAGAAHAAAGVLDAIVIGTNIGG